MARNTSFQTMMAMPTMMEMMRRAILQAATQLERIG